jgi:anti-anti-sigma factor
MAAQPVTYAINAYTDRARKIVCPAALVRGHEQNLLAIAMPALEKGDLTLDMSQVTQLDAAGLGMLVVLHHCAAQSGHRLRLLNPGARVAQLLSLTKLDAIFTEQ